MQSWFSKQFVVQEVLEIHWHWYVTFTTFISTLYTEFLKFDLAHFCPFLQMLSLEPGNIPTVCLSRREIMKHLHKAHCVKCVFFRISAKWIHRPVVWLRHMISQTQILLCVKVSIFPVVHHSMSFNSLCLGVSFLGKKVGERSWLLLNKPRGGICMHTG